MLPGCKLAAAQELAERVRRTMACEQDAVVGTITLSLGVGAWQPGECSSTLLPAPAWALRLALGEMSVLLLGGQHLQPQRTQASGFNWRYPRLEPALMALLR